MKTTALIQIPPLGAPHPLTRLRAMDARSRLIRDDQGVICAALVEFDFELLPLFSVDRAERLPLLAAIFAQQLSMRRRRRIHVVASCHARFVVWCRANGMKPHSATVCYVGPAHNLHGLSDAEVVLVDGWRDRRDAAEIAEILHPQRAKRWGIKVSAAL